MRAAVYSFAFCLFSLLLFVTPAAFAGPVQIDTAQGPVTLENLPERIAVLDTASADTILALGVVPDGVVKPLFVKALEEQVASVPAVGSLFEPDFEKIAALAPDVIVIGARAQTHAAALSKIAPVLDMSVGRDALGDGLARLEAFGHLTGRSAEAAALAKDLRAKTEHARALVAKEGNALIVMTNGPKLSVFGPQSRFGWLHTALGWRAAKADIAASPHGEAVSFEYIADANPEVLLVIDRGQAVSNGMGNAAATLDTALIAGTKAARTGRVIYLSAAEIYVAGGGVQALNVTMDEIIAALEN